MIPVSRVIPSASVCRPRASGDDPFIEITPENIKV